MEELFVPYTEALALKELGFNEDCFGYFYTTPNSKMFGIDEKFRHYPIKNTPKKLYKIGEHFVLKDKNVITAPTYSQAFKFFRDKHGLESHVKKDWADGILQGYESIIECLDGYIDVGTFKIYEEAELECLKKLIEIVKNN